jgi:hypothetical protein
MLGCRCVLVQAARSSMKKPSAIGFTAVNRRRACRAWQHASARPQSRPYVPGDQNHVIGCLGCARNDVCGSLSGHVDQQDRVAPAQHVQAGVDRIALSVRREQSPTINAVVTRRFAAEQPRTAFTTVAQGAR